MDGKEEGRFNIINDTGDDNTHCHRCRKKMPHDDGYTCCWDCIEASGEVSVSGFTQCHLRYMIDGTGTIWTGMPDNPEPEISLKDLPIFKEHPDLDLYNRIPFSCLSEQLGLKYRMQALKYRRQAAGPGDSLQYRCFIVGETSSIQSRCLSTLDILLPASQARLHTVSIWQQRRSVGSCELITICSRPQAGGSWAYLGLTLQFNVKRGTALQPR